MYDIGCERACENIDIAYNFARKAHEGQVDKAGVPYIVHPVTVAGMVDTPEEKIVALLHDVVEDTPVSIEAVRNLFGDRIADAVSLLTHDKSVPYENYVKLIKGNELARKVKIADLKHNMDLRRIPNPKAEDMDRVVYKYIPAYVYLIS